MQDFPSILKRHKTISDIISVKDGVYIIFHDHIDNEILKNLNFLELKRAFTLSELPVRVKELLDGYSTRYRRHIYELFGLKRNYLVTYNLKPLTHSKKTLFGYALKGRGKQKGMLGELEGSVVGRNNVMVPEQSLESLRSFLEYWRVGYQTQTIYVDNKQKKLKK